MPFQLRLLGVPHYSQGDTWTALPDNQPLMLAAYLAYQEDWVSRDALLALFWPDEAEKAARHNLSQLLYQTKGQKWVEGLETERTRTRWSVATDVHAFREAFGEGDWQRSVELYAGRLLDGISTDAFIDYDEWLANEREDLQATWREAVLKYCADLEKSAQYGEAASLLKQVLKQDALAEDVLQAYLRFATAEGQRDGALKTYQTFKKQLQDELGLEPLEETVLLAERLQDLSVKNGLGVTAMQQPLSERVTKPPQLDRERPAALSAISTQDTPTAPILNHFPQHLTPFVGREVELAELTSALADPECRLLTLFGPGGMGKSRLAMEVALENAAKYRHGATLIPLAAVPSADLVPSAVADALAFAPSPDTPLNEQILSFLEAQEALLVIDNFEHVLDAADSLRAILETAPKVRILVTSREPLGFQSEWLYELKGMDVPAVGEDNKSEHHTSVQLFLRTARRALPQFSLQDIDKAWVARICRSLSGMPLGIELAAQWVRLLSVEEIAEELEQGLDFLEASHRDLPERHRSLRAVFDYSWQLLSESERQALKDLSVFQGGFSKDAATSVTSASLRNLLSLVNKALLSRTQNGRFERLIIVQQFAKERAEGDAKAYEEIREKHANYYLSLVKKAEPELVGADQAQWLKTLSVEHDNLRAALHYFKDEHNIEEGLSLTGSLWYFWHMRNYLDEGRNQLKQFLDLASDEHSVTIRAKALRGAGVLAERQNDLAEAEHFYGQSLAMSRELEDEQAVAGILNNLANLAFRRLDYARAKNLYEESLAIYRKQKVTWRMAIGLSNLGLVASLQGDYEAAQRYFEESLELSKGAENSWMVASTLSKLGELAQNQAQYDLAQNHYQGSLRLKQALEDEEGAAALLSQLGSIAFFQGDYSGARALLDESLSTMIRLKSEQGVATAQYHLALVEHTETNHPKALALLKDCLSKFETPKSVAKTLDALAVIAVSEKQCERAVTLFAAGDQLRETAGILKTPQEERWLEPFKEGAEETLKPNQISEARKRGKRMSQAEAAAFGLA